MSEPQVELREPQPYLGIHEPSIDSIRQFADSTFPELFGWLSEHGVAPAGPPFIRVTTRSTTGASRSTSRSGCRSTACPRATPASAPMRCPRAAT